MKTQQVILTTSIVAGVDLTVYRFAGFDGKPCVAGARALGVVEADTETGNVAPVNVLGIVVVEAGAAIEAGAAVEADNAGRAITKTAGAENGVAWDAATAAGDLIRIVRGI